MYSQPITRRSALNWVGAGACMTAGFAPPSNAQQESAAAKVRHGHLEHLQGLAWQHVQPRPVQVWLPPEHEQLQAAGQRYAVIYMHDGQMLWDASTTWNRQAWEVDVTLSRLMQSGEIGPTMVVGIGNAGEHRHSEYFPQKHLQYLPAATRETFLRQALRGRSQADAYLRFLVEELKPLIDRRYPTRPGPGSTALLGASMGGMISVYGLCEYPKIFGRAAGLSTHWVGSHQASAALSVAAFRYLQAHLPAPAGLRLYQDHGTTELDALYPPHQRIVDQIVRDRGWRESGPEVHYMSRVFEGTGHNEKAWAQRLDVPVKFLLGR
ncbi:MAG: alpha/beta hydrolase [Limnohabitans sp.]